MRKRFSLPVDTVAILISPPFILRVGEPLGQFRGLQFDGLWKTSEAAQAAAFQDPRFSPLTVTELEKVDIEVSVLSPFEPISSYDEIEIGKHGLLLDEGGRAVLLPQVATENNFDQELSINFYGDILKKIK